MPYMSTQNDEDKKVFVKNIPSSVTDKEITDFFQFAGKTVSVVVKQYLDYNFEESEK